MTLPNFLVIGAARCGTTSLYSYLKQHPQIFLPEKKDPKFFSHENTKIFGPKIESSGIEKLENYEELFNKATENRKAIGEVSPSYLYSKIAPEKAKKIIPEAKIIIILRNPLERAHSLYNFLKSGEFEIAESFEEALELEEQRIKANWDTVYFYKKRGKYYEQIKEWLKHFDLSKIKIILFDDLAKNPEKTLKKIFEFLEIDNSIRIDTESKYNLDLSNPRNPTIKAEKTFVTEHYINPITKKQLILYFEEDIDNLEKLIEKDLSDWTDLKESEKAYIPVKNFIKESATKFPNKTAIIYKNTEIKYRELDYLIEERVEELKEKGIKEGETVAILFPNSPEFIINYFALLNLKSIVFPLNPDLTEREINDLERDSPINYLIYPENIIIKKTEEKTSPKEYFMRTYSSGSTGRPKQVLKTDFNLFHDCWHYLVPAGFSSEDIFLGVAPFHHMYGILNLLFSTYLGATLVIEEKFSPRRTAEAINKNKVSVFLGTPTMFELLTELDNIDLSSLRIGISSTGLLKKEVYEKFNSKFNKSLNIAYGSTETGSVTLLNTNNKKYEEGLVGKPMSEIKIGIADTNNQEKLVSVKTPASSEFYINNPEETKKTFKEGRIILSDIGKIDSEGNLYIEKRSILIDIGGRKIDPYETEKILNMHPSIKESIVYEKNGRLKSAIVKNSDLSKEDIITFCKDKLAPFKTPRSIEFLDELPKDSNGKILRSRLT